jgi:hypothetical protein
MLSSRDLGRDTFDVPECRTPAIRSRLARYPLALELVQLRNRVASPPAQPGIEGSHRINGWTNQLFLPLQVFGREVGREDSPQGLSKTQRRRLVRPLAETCRTASPDCPAPDPITGRSSPSPSSPVTVLSLVAGGPAPICPKPSCHPNHDDRRSGPRGWLASALYGQTPALPAA